MPGVRGSRQCLSSLSLRGLFLLFSEQNQPSRKTLCRSSPDARLGRCRVNFLSHGRKTRCMYIRHSKAENRGGEGYCMLTTSGFSLSSSWLLSSLFHHLLAPLPLAVLTVAEARSPVSGPYRLVSLCLSLSVYVHRYVVCLSVYFCGWAQVCSIQILVGVGHDVYGRP